MHDHSSEVDGHHHHHGHDLPAHLSKAFYWGIGLNLLYVIIEAVIGWIQGSMALLSDAGHNLSDVAGLLIALLAMKLSGFKSSARFTFGYKKSTIWASLINALLLLTACGAIFLESIRRLQEPKELDGGIVSIIAAIGIAINFGSALLFMRDKERDINLKAAYLHLMADAAISAAVVIGGILMKYTQWYYLDALLSMGIVIVIVFTSSKLLWQSVRMGMDAVPSELDIKQLQYKLQSLPEVADVHHLHVWAISTTYNALTAHIRLKQNLSLEQIAPIKEELKHIALHFKVQHCTFEFELAGEECVEC